MKMETELASKTSRK